MARNLDGRTEGRMDTSIPIGSKEVFDRYGTNMLMTFYLQKYKQIGPGNAIIQISISAKHFKKKNKQ